MGWLNRIVRYDAGLITVVLSLWMLSGAAMAGMDDIAKDFKVLDGFVVMAKDGRFIIDLDDTQGVAVGDLFSVIGPGATVIHPVTQKALGRLDEVKGILKVTRVKQGFSFARALGSSAQIKRGDPIRRFSALKALFWDYTQENDSLFVRLQQQLPDLNWLDYRSAQAGRPTWPGPLPGQENTLLFIVTGESLEVRDAELGLIRTYALDSLFSGLAPSVDGTAASVQAPAASTADDAGRLANSGQIKAEAISAMAGRVMMADLIQLNTKLLLAATDGTRVDVFAVNDQLSRVAVGNMRPGSRILALKWWRPAVDRPLYLTVVAWLDQEIESAVFALKNDRLVALRQGIDAILGTFDVDADGLPEMLLRQEFDRNTFYGRRIKEIFWEKGRLATRTPELALPPSFTVIGGQLADLTQDGKAEAIYVNRGILQIYADKKALYSSPKKMGGSRSVLTYKKDPTFKDYITTSVFFEIAPVTVDIDADGKPELLAVSSDQSMIKLPGIAAGPKESRLVYLEYENGAFVENPLGVELDAAVQGLFAAEGKVLCVATGAGSKSGLGATSRLWKISLPSIRPQ